MRRCIECLVLGVLLVLAASAGNAILIDYEFNGTVGTGTLDLVGSPQQHLAGQPFTASGTITSETDVNPFVFIGQFTATTLYDFGSLGSFTTDAGADFFFQNESSFTATTGFGLADAGLNGFEGRENSTPLTDPNAPEALGLIVFESSAHSTRTQTNAAGDSFAFTSINVTDVNISPEPTTAALLSLGLAGLALRQQRSRH